MDTRHSLARLAAIVLNYRTPADTLAAVASLRLSQRRIDDLIIVDNDPDDECRRALAVDPAVIYLSTEENLGFSGGMNVGIRAALARGADAILLVNSDATVPPDCLAHLVEALESTAGAGIAGPVLRSRSQPDRIASVGMTYAPRSGRMRHRLAGTRQPSFVSRGVRRVDGVSGCVMLVTRRVFESIGLLEEDYFYSFEDLAFCLTARRAGFTTVVAEMATAYHEGGRSIGADSPRRLYFAARNHLLLATRHGSPGALAAPLRALSIVALNAAHAIKSRGGSLPARLLAVWRGTRDYRSGRLGNDRPESGDGIAANESPKQRRAIAQDLEGVLESPTYRMPDATTLTVSGWVFSKGSPIRTLELLIDSRPSEQIVYGLPRADVGSVFSDAMARTSGFGCQVQVGPRQMRELSIEIVATLDDGNRVACFDRTVSLEKKREVLRPSAPRKLWNAIRERRLPLSPASWTRLLADHRRQGRRSSDRAPATMNSVLFESSYSRWLLSRGALLSVASRVEVADSPPISIVALVDASSPIVEIVRSTRSQPLASWQLWLVLPAADRRTLDGLIGADASRDARVHAIGLPELAGSGGAWSPPGEGDYVVLLDARTILAPDALSHAHQVIQRAAADWTYTDDDLLDDTGRRRDPNLKGDFSPEFALVDDYATRLAIVRRSTIRDVGGLRPEYGDAQIYDLFLRVALGGGRVQHLAEIGCHRLTPTPAVPSPLQRLAAERAFLASHHVSATIEVGRHISPATVDVPRIRWPDNPAQPQDVTIVIPTRDRADLLGACIASLRRTVNFERVRLLIVDDHSEKASTLELLRELEGDRELHCRVLRAGWTDDGFNYARLINAGSREVETSLMLQLNNDIEAITSGWLDQMVGWFSVTEVGVVGAKLLYPNHSIQHAGVLVSPSHGTPEHLFCGLSADDAGYQWLPHRARNVSAVTGACLLTRTQLFRELDGLDEEHLGVQFNDIDYCLRVIASGRRIVYEPAAILRHDASSSRGFVHNFRENLFFHEAHRDYHDPFISGHLDMNSVCGPTPIVRAPADREA